MASSNLLFELEQLNVDANVDVTFMFEEINKEVEEYLLEKSIDTDSTGWVFDFLESLTNRVQEDFDNTMGEETEKTIYQDADVYLRPSLQYRNRLSGQNQKNT